MCLAKITLGGLQQIELIIHLQLTVENVNSLQCDIFYFIHQKMVVEVMINSLNQTGKE